MGQLKLVDSIYNAGLKFSDQPIKVIKINKNVKVKLVINIYL